ncbi:MAG: glycosyltransferase family 4 protein [Candidatus Dormibacteraeota bacterium]|nr:glycosyltransferase family 4 protein [Candidatus Dormibacteraeota bacterium]MBV9526313.1 glycosyltransferase family 4 protein [Candidatus Dormibacteraeota bacterium]
MFSPRTLEIVMVSFEGPDQYSQAGGLGVRARELCRALAARGFTTTLVFVGDPSKPMTEEDAGVRLVRWCQDLSRRTLAGVYEGEWEKLAELSRTLPPYLVEHVFKPAASAGRVVAVLCEEWHTARFCHVLSDMLHREGLRDRAVLLWNANNDFGFGGIDWGALNFVSSVTTVSKYMKHLMWQYGVNPVVIPNGIPESALGKLDKRAVGAIRAAAGTPCLTFKIGRFSPDKRWHQALGAVAELRSEGLPARLLMRGGIEPFGAQVLSFARSIGLTVVDWYEPIEDASGVVAALAGTNGAEVVNLGRFLPDAVIAEINAAATAVLANSRHEPFGLVGLEAMAAGGIAMVGATGEEYARPYGNAVVIETDDPAEVASALRGLVEQPALARRLREAARRDAADFAWPLVIDGLLERLRFMCMHQRVVTPPDGAVRIRRH